MAEVVGLPGRPTSAKVIIAELEQAQNIEAIVVAARIGGRWATIWGGQLTGPDLALATLKLLKDVLEDADA